LHLAIGFRSFVLHGAGNFLPGVDLFTTGDSPYLVSSPFLLA